MDIDTLSPIVLRRLLAYVEDCMQTDMRVSKGEGPLEPFPTAITPPNNGVDVKGSEFTLFNFIHCFKAFF